MLLIIENKQQTKMLNKSDSEQGALWSNKKKILCSNYDMHNNLSLFFYFVSSYVSNLVQKHLSMNLTIMRPCGK